MCLVALKPSASSMWFGFIHTCIHRCPLMTYEQSYRVLRLHFSSFHSFDCWMFSLNHMTAISFSGAVIVGKEEEG